MSRSTMRLAGLGNDIVSSSSTVHRLLLPRNMLFCCLAKHSHGPQAPRPRPPRPVGKYDRQHIANYI